MDRATSSIGGFKRCCEVSLVTVFVLRLTGCAGGQRAMLAGGVQGQVCQSVAARVRSVPSPTTHGRSSLSRRGTGRSRPRLVTDVPVHCKQAQAGVAERRRARDCNCRSGQRQRAGGEVERIIWRAQQWGGGVLAEGGGAGPDGVEGDRSVGHGRLVSTSKNLGVESSVQRGRAAQQQRSYEQSQHSRLSRGPLALAGGVPGGGKCLPGTSAVLVSVRSRPRQPQQAPLSAPSACSLVGCRRGGYQHGTPLETTSSGLGGRRYAASEMVAGASRSTTPAPAGRQAAEGCLPAQARVWHGAPPRRLGFTRTPTSAAPPMTTLTKALGCAGRVQGRPGGPRPKKKAMRGRSQTGTGTWAGGSPAVEMQVEPPATRGTAMVSLTRLACVQLPAAAVRGRCQEATQSIAMGRQGDADAGLLLGRTGGSSVASNPAGAQASA